MSRIDDLEQRIADLEAEIGTRRGRPGFRASTALDPGPRGDQYEGPYGYGSQVR